MDGAILLIHKLERTITYITLYLFLSYWPTFIYSIQGSKGFSLQIEDIAFWEKPWEWFKILHLERNLEKTCRRCYWRCYVQQDFFAFTTIGLKLEVIWCSVWRELYFKYESLSRTTPLILQFKYHRFHIRMQVWSSFSLLSVLHFESCYSIQPPTIKPFQANSNYTKYFRLASILLLLHIQFKIYGNVIT